MVRRCQSSPEIWAFLRSTYHHEDLITRVTALKKLLLAVLTEHQDISKFLDDWRTLLDNALLSGLLLDDSLQTMLLLAALPTSWRPFITTQASVVGLTMEILIARILQEDAMRGNSTPTTIPSSQYVQRQSNFRRRPFRRFNNTRNPVNNPTPAKICIHCGRHGHLVHECRTKRREQQRTDRRPRSQLQHIEVPALSNAHDLPVQILRSDNGGEYVSNAFQKFCKDVGIQQQYTTPYTPQQNGVSERKNRTLVSAARAMLLTAGLSKPYWEEAVATAGYLQNRIPHAIDPQFTPYYHWFGKIPTLEHLRVFGCSAYPVQAVSLRHKLDATATKMVFVGYGDRLGVKAYRLYDPHHKKFHFARSVYFDESSLISPQQGITSPPQLTHPANPFNSADPASSTSVPRIEWEEEDVLRYIPLPNQPQVPPIQQLPSSPVPIGTPLPPNAPPWSLGRKTKTHLFPNIPHPLPVEPIAASSNPPHIQPSNSTPTSSSTPTSPYVPENPIHQPSLLGPSPTSRPSKSSKVRSLKEIYQNSHHSLLMDPSPSSTPIISNCLHEASFPDVAAADALYRQVLQAFSDDDFDSLLLVVETIDEISLDEALSGPEASSWRQAMDSEYQSIMANGTWQLVPAPPNRKLVTCKWLLCKKFHADGSVSRYKARLVARGFTQIPGMDYSETFSPVLRITSFRVLIAIAALFGSLLYQMDVRTAFLNGDLQEEIYMSQPDGGYTSLQHPDYVCRLLKALYGLKQSPRQCNELTGAFPPSLWNVTKITLSTNNHLSSLLSGHLPPDTNSHLQHVHYVVCFGQVPSPPWIAELDVLFIVDLAQNKFVSPLPVIHANYVNISHNQLTGSIPEAYGNIGLNTLDLSFNRFSGRIPSNFTSGSGFFNNLVLSHNLLTGPLPQQIFASIFFNSLDLSHNNLSGPIPNTFPDTTPFLSSLDLSFNQLSGAVPPKLFTFSSLLVKVKLGHNQLTGEIPSLGQACQPTATQLNFVALNDNKFTGSLSSASWIGECAGKFTVFDISGNTLTGSIPDFSSWTELRVLNLARNRFTSSLPSYLFTSLPLLQVLDLSRNHLSGPLMLKNVSGLKAMLNGSGAESRPVRGGPYYKDGLVFSGIDFVLSFTLTLATTTVIDLSHNLLSGDLAEPVDSLAGLRVLEVANNRLSGSLPSSLGYIKSLQILDVSNNSFSGPIPASLQDFPASDFSGNPGLLWPPFTCFLPLINQHHTKRNKWGL
ncbi:hypothetical protein L7F22_034703 [Adiantum nelumboides]|nr:hypothetical protein [Adiantum nelumboides]